ncbi:MAG: hypothetical protein IKJ23_03890 [Bacteroidaceae bacterium]|nr:hypothetical protein [Bacteroidaceae bacterium]
MKFRLYQILHIAAIALLVMALIGNVAFFIGADGSTSVLDNFKYAMPDGSSSSSVVALGVVLIVAAVVNAFALLVSLFSNFALLKRCLILSMLVLAGYYILLLVYSFILIDESAVDMCKGMFFPLAVLAANALAFVMTRREEARIVAKALGFRLRD